MRSYEVVPLMSAPWSVSSFLTFLRGLGLQEQHVLQQVRHAGFAVALVARAHQVGHVDRDLRLGGIGEQQDVQAVRQGVLGDALHGGDLLNALRKGLEIGRIGENKEKRERSLIANDS